MSLRNELLDMLQKRVDINRENAAAQIKNDTTGLKEALMYSMRADVTEEIMFHVHSILGRHGQ